jgi:hypothetical protein
VCLVGSALLAAVLLALVSAAPALADFQQQEGSAPSQTLATDTNYFDCPGSEHATIQWGDGVNQRLTVPGNCTVIPGQCYYDSDGNLLYCDPDSYSETYPVTASHSYRDAGFYSYSYTADNGSGSGTATVWDAYISGAGGGTRTAVEGTSSRVTLGTIHDYNGLTDPGSDYKVSIDWGDGSRVDTASGGVSGGDPTALAVAGSHTYTEESAVGYHVTATITDDDGAGSSSTTVAATVIVDDASPRATAVNGLTATQNVSSGNVLLAHFTDPDQFGAITDYNASIDWGDGQVTDGSIAPGNGGFDVSGQHTYASLGVYNVAVTIRDAGGSGTEAFTSITVNNSPHPEASTGPATSVTPTSALLTSTVDPRGGATARFEYSTSSALAGATVTAPQVVPTGLGAQPVTATVTGLIPRTTYYYRIDAIDPSGASVSGAIGSFRTPAPLKRINSTMTWNFSAFHGYVIVGSLIVHQVPTHARVEVSCSGRGCPRAVTPAINTAAAPSPRCHSRCGAGHTHGPAAFRDVDLTRSFGSRHVAFGDEITVRIVGPGYIGKIYLFKIRNGVNPTIGCLAPGSTLPNKGC